MYYAAAADRLTRLHATLTSARETLAAHMAAFEAARAAHDTARRQESELLSLLRAAQLRRAQRERDLATAESELREAVEGLAETEALYHGLESQLAAYAGCQRSAVVLLMGKQEHEDDTEGARKDQHEEKNAVAHSVTQESEGETTRLSEAAAASPLPHLCWLDPFSLLHTTSGKALHYDSVTLADSLEAAWECGDEITDKGLYGDERGDLEGEGIFRMNADGSPDASQRTSVTKLVQEAVHDVLQGFHYTLLATSFLDADGAGPPDGLCSSIAREATTVAAEATTAGKGITDMTARHPGSERDGSGAAGTFTRAGQLCRRALALLQRAAVQCGTRALSVRLAVGQVHVPEGPESSDECLMDLLAPVVAAAKTGAVHQAASKTHAPGVPTVMMDAALGNNDGGGVDGGDYSSSRGGRSPSAGVDAASRRQSGPSVHRSHSRGSSRRPFDTLNINAPSTAKHSTEARFAVKEAAPSTLLTGVPVASREEVDAWLQATPLFRPSSAANAAAPSAKRCDAWCDDSPCGRGCAHVVLLGIDSQDAAGRVHKAVLRILDVPLTSEGLCHGHDTFAEEERRRSTGVAADPVGSSLFPVYMYDALSALLTEAEHTSPGRHRSQAGVGDVAAVEFCVERLRTEREEGARRAERPARGAVSSLRMLLQAPPPWLAAMAPGRRTEWLLWAALLRSVLGGDSKALWLHVAAASSSPLTPPCATATDGGRRREQSSCRCREVRDDAPWDSDGVTRCSEEAVLGMCALFCRLVRHDAVPCEVSADLDRFLHSRV